MLSHMTGRPDPSQCVYSAQSVLTESVHRAVFISGGLFKVFIYSSRYSPDLRY